MHAQSPPPAMEQSAVCSGAVSHEGAQPVHHVIADGPGPSAAPSAQCGGGSSKQHLAGGSGPSAASSAQHKGGSGMRQHLANASATAAATDGTWSHGRLPMQLVAVVAAARANGQLDDCRRAASDLSGGPADSAGLPDGVASHPQEAAALPRRRPSGPGGRRAPQTIHGLTP